MKLKLKRGFLAPSRPTPSDSQWRAAPAAARRQQGKAAPSAEASAEQLELRALMEEAQELCSSATREVRDLASVLDCMLEDGAGRLAVAAGVARCPAQARFLTAAVDRLKLRMARTCVHALKQAEKGAEAGGPDGAIFFAMHSALESMFVNLVETSMEEVEFVRPDGAAQTAHAVAEANTAALTAAAAQATATVADAATSPSPSPPPSPSLSAPHAQPSASSGGSPTPASSSKQQQQQPDVSPHYYVQRGGGGPAEEQQAPAADGDAGDSKREQPHEERQRRRRRGSRGGKKARARRQKQQHRQTNAAPATGQQHGRQTHRDAELELCAILGRGFNAMTEVFAAVLVPRGAGQGSKAPQQQRAPHTKVGQQPQQRQAPPAAPPQPEQQQQPPATPKPEMAQPTAAPPGMAVGKGTQQLTGTKRDRSNRSPGAAPEDQRNVAAASVALAIMAA